MLRLEIIILSGYVRNNALILIDLTGEEWYSITEEYEEEEEYTDENGETKTRTVTKTRQSWKWFKDKPEMDVWTGEYDADGNKVYETRKGISGNELAEENGNTIFLAANGLKGSVEPGLYGFGFVVNYGYNGSVWYTTPGELFLAGVLPGVGTGIARASSARWFRKYIFNVAKTKQGGTVVTLFGKLKYVGERISRHGVQICYKRSIKWGDMHLKDFK
jgi:hypothetical protein